MVRTDLHTHFAGILSPDELIALAQKHDLTLDAKTAALCGIANADIKVNDLDTRQLTMLRSGLGLDAGQQNLFEDLDQVYANRAFITKNRAMFVPLMEAIAQSYAHQGVEYAELSFAGIISDPSLVEDMHKHLPEIEKKTGTKLRFLGALWRHSDIEWNMDETDRLKEVLKSPYVVGIDVMGHEKNPIRQLTEPLQEIVRYAAQNIPGFAIRIHAGENPYYSADPDKLDDYNFNNTYEAIKIIDDARRDIDGNLSGAQAQGVQIRVGHGRYGIHDKTMELMKKAGVVAELCITSNWMLNHAQKLTAPFAEYLRHGVAFVLGSDGYGMYGTSQPTEQIRARLGGMTPEAEALMNESETKILQFDKARFAQKVAAWKQHEIISEVRQENAFDAMKNPRFSTPDGKQRWSSEAQIARQQRERDAEKALTTHLNENLGISTDMNEIQTLLKTKNMILFSGASKTSWAKIPENQQKKIRVEMEKLIDKINPDQDVIVTGGTDFGFEAVIHELVEKRNKSLPANKEIAVIGALTLEANTREIRPGTLSHAFVLPYGNSLATSWMDQPAALLDLLEKNDGHAVMVGGGQVVNDMIIDAHGRGLVEEKRLHLMEGIAGASGDKAEVYKGAAFKNVGQLTKQLWASPLVRFANRVLPLNVTQVS